MSDIIKILTEKYKVDKDVAEAVKENLYYRSSEEVIHKLTLLQNVEAVIPLPNYEKAAIFICNEGLFISVFDNGKEDYHDEDLAMDKEVDFVDVRWLSAPRESIISFEAIYHTCSEDNCDRCSGVIKEEDDINYNLGITTLGGTYNVTFGGSQYTFKILSELNEWLYISEKKPENNG